MLLRSCRRSIRSACHHVRLSASPLATERTLPEVAEHASAWRFLSVTAVSTHSSTSVTGLNSRVLVHHTSFACRATR